MYLKRYTLSAIIYIFVIGAFVNFNVTNGSYSLSFFGINLPQLPIFVLVLVPIILFYFASLMHMIFYSMLGSFRLRKYQKDYEKILNAIYDAFLNKSDRNYVYKTDRYTSLGKVIDKSIIMPTSELRTVGNDKIDSLLILIEDIKQGKACDLKKLNLDSSNQLLIANQNNQLKDGSLKVNDVLSNQNRYDNSVVKSAFLIFVATAQLSQIKKYIKLLEKKSFFILVNRLKNDENCIELNNSELIELLSNLSFDEKDFIKLSKLLVGKIEADSRIKLFELMGEKSDKAISAYIYTLLDLEMNSLVDEILENSQEDEFLEYKAYRALKSLNKSFDLDLFVK